MNRRGFLLLGSSSLMGAMLPRTLAQAQVAANDLEVRISELMEQENVPGLSIALLAEGEIAWSKQFGVLKSDGEDRVDERTTFEAASLSKPVFAYLVHKLIENGELDLDKRMLDYHPASFNTEDTERLESMTVRHVLSHSTGLPNWHNNANKPARIRRDPGERFGYSGMAYVYLQHAVEKIAQQSLDELLAQRVFAPLKMESASMVWRDDYETRLAFGHSKNLKRVYRQKQTRANAASSLVCTARDYARFVATILKPPASNETFLARPSIDKMLTPEIEVRDGIAWGLGWGLQNPDSDDPTFWHWGNNGDAYNAFVVGSRRTGAGAVVMTNSGNGLRVCREIIPSLIDGPHPAFQWPMVVY